MWVELLKVVFYGTTVESTKLTFEVSTSYEHYEILDFLVAKLKMCIVVNKFL